MVIEWNEKKLNQYEHIEINTTREQQYLIPDVISTLAIWKEKKQNHFQITEEEEEEKELSNN